MMCFAERAVIGGLSYRNFLCAFCFNFIPIFYVNEHPSITRIFVFTDKVKRLLLRETVQIFHSADFFIADTVMGHALQSAVIRCIGSTIVSDAR